ncbi:MAG: class II fructose-bisphosphate aldolase [Candidatus Brocadiia bacterium]
MSLSKCAPLVERAQKEGWAIAQLNTNGATYGLTRAIVETADEERAPVILGAYAANAQYRGLPYCAQHMRFMAEKADVPVAVHLDHGKSVEICAEAVEAGFTSVMYDGSKLPVDENIANTTQVVEKSSTTDASVEAEVGQLQDDDSAGENLSDPHEVRRMCEETEIDFLAVGIGTAHGFYDVEPNVHLDLLAELDEISSVPLVLHGTTGLNDDVVRACIARGIAKVNVGTLIRTRYVEYTREAIEAGSHDGHPWRVSREAMNRVKEDVRYVLRLTGSSGKC